MITSWETIAQRVAEQMDLPYEVVKQEILDYAAVLKQGIVDKQNIEYEYFGLGKLMIKPIKLKKERFKHLQWQYDIAKRGGRAKYRESKKKNLE